MILLEEIVDNLYFKTLDIFNLEHDFNFLKHSQDLEFDLMQIYKKDIFKYEFLKISYKKCFEDNVFLRLKFKENFNFVNFLDYNIKNNLELRDDNSYFLLNQIFPLIYSNLEFSYNCASFMDNFILLNLKHFKK